MNKFSKSFITLVAVGAVATTAVARERGQNITFLAPTGEDLSSAVTMATPDGPDALKAIDVPRETIAVSWAVPADKPLETPTPFVAQSREYFVDVDADELRSGVPIYTHGPGALIRLNPADGRAVGPVDPLAVVLISADKTSFATGTGMELLASAEQLRASGSPFIEGTAAFQISTELGAGALGLQVPDLAGDGRYVMHVLDQQSPVVLSLQTGQANYLHGQTLTVEAAFEGGRLEGTEGFVTSPGGNAWPLSWETGSDGISRATLNLDGLEAPAPGLWEVHASARGTAGAASVLRHARVAFNCGVPAARLGGDAQLTATPGVSISLGIEVASAGRYEARGVLMGTALDGSLSPIAVAHSADWLESGARSLVLAFDADVVKASGLSRPFEVRDLQLVNQGTMTVLHRQARGLIIR